MKKHEREVNAYLDWIEIPWRFLNIIKILDNERSLRMDFEDKLSLAIDVIEKKENEKVYFLNYRDFILYEFELKDVRENWIRINPGVTLEVDFKNMVFSSSEWDREWPWLQRLKKIDKDKIWEKKWEFYYNHCHYNDCEILK